MQAKKIAYWLSTVLLCFVFLYSAFMYFSNTEMVQGFFESFNYPTYIVIPLAIVKIIGVIIVVWRPNTWLTEWAYAGFFFDLVLATAAHHFADHSLGLSFFAIPFLFISYFLGKYIRD